MGWLAAVLVAGAVIGAGADQRRLRVEGNFGCKIFSPPQAGACARLGTVGGSIGGTADEKSECDARTSCPVPLSGSCPGGEDAADRSETNPGGCCKKPANTCCPFGFEGACPGQKCASGGIAQGFGSVNGHCIYCCNVVDDLEAEARGIKGEHSDADRGHSGASGATGRAGDAGEDGMSGDSGDSGDSGSGQVELDETDEKESTTTTTTTTSTTTRKPTQCFYKSNAGEDEHCQEIDGPNHQPPRGATRYCNPECNVDDPPCERCKDGFKPTTTTKKPTTTTTTTTRSPTTTKAANGVGGKGGNFFGGNSPGGASAGTSTGNGGAANNVNN